MKRSGIKPGKVGLKRTSMARGSSTLKAKTPMERSSKPIKVNPGKPKKSRGPGLKGRAPTAEERRFMDLAGSVPCLACSKDGRENHAISLHHISGRTAPGAHLLVLPLCPAHHQQDDSDPLGRISVHGAKKSFVDRYGSEMDLLAELRALLCRNV